MIPLRDIEVSTCLLDGAIEKSSQARIDQGEQNHVVVTKPVEHVIVEMLLKLCVVSARRLISS